MVFNTTKLRPGKIVASIFIVEGSLRSQAYWRPAARRTISAWGGSTHFVLIEGQPIAVDESGMAIVGLVRSDFSSIQPRIVEFGNKLTSIQLSPSTGLCNFSG